MELELCPFCGRAAEFERVGTRSHSCIVACTNCGASVETFETGDMCGQFWNTRIAAAVSGADERAAFEAKVRSVNPELDERHLKRLETGSYAYFQFNAMWRGWEWRAAIDAAMKA